MGFVDPIVGVYNWWIDLRRLSLHFQGMVNKHIKDVLWLIAIIAFGVVVGLMIEHL